MKKPDTLSQLIADIYFDGGAAETYRDRVRSLYYDDQATEKAIGDLLASAIYDGALEPVFSDRAQKLITL